MADPKQLKILKSGVAKWNFWRNSHLEAKINLSRADLAGNDLSWANFYRANLSGANLFGVNLSWANLGGASNMSLANLGGAILTGANLSGASLNGANLIGANVTSSDMVGADLTSAHLLETVLSDVNLRNARGLEACTHLGPSTVDHRTLLKSGPLPLRFLRGCGLPERLIEYLPSLLGAGPIQFYSCFISYSANDRSLAERLHADLQDNGVRCWFAPEDLKIGDPFRQRIDDAIRRHDKLLLLLSKHSVESDWVREEVESCLERERLEKRPVLFPVQLDGVVDKTTQAWAASIRRQRHIGDFRNWKRHDSYKKGFDRLLRDLKPKD